MINVTVCYPLPDEQLEKHIAVPVGSSVAQVLRLSGLLEQYDLVIGKLTVGVFGETVPLDAPVVAGDRIEIYRPLTIDPKEARRLKSLKQKR